MVTVVTSGDFSSVALGCREVLMDLFDLMIEHLAVVYKVGNEFLNLSEYEKLLVGEVGYILVLVKSWFAIHPNHPPPDP
jgi:hypothetical protein